MLRNYFKIGIRNLLKNKAFSVINISGLAIGLTGCLLMALYVRHELRYDAFHEKGNRIVRVVMEYSMGGEVNKVAVTGTKVAPAFRQTFPEVESAVRMYKTDRIVKANDKLLTEPRFYYADSTFFDLFSFQLLAGNPRTALTQPNTVVLSASTARRYFGTEEAIGKIIRVNDEKDFVVTGVAADCPDNSQIKFDFLASFHSLRAAQNETWWNANWTTFLLLRTSESIASLQPKIRGYMKTQFSEEEMSGGDYLTYFLEAFPNVHLYSDTEGTFEPNSDIDYIYIFIGTALLLLGIACFTYLNLTTARATERAREVGMRKVLGAVRQQLFWQFISESVILTAIALFLSCLLVAFTLPAFNQLIGKQLSLSAFFQSKNILFVLGLGLAIAFLAGSYPAVVLTGFQPIKVLKGSFKNTASGLRLRQSLIVFQFAISVFLIVSAFVIQDQLQFIQTRKLGYDKEHVLVVPINGKIDAKIAAFKTEFRQNPNVLQVARAYETPVFVEGGYSIWASGMPEGKYKAIKALPVDNDFVKTTGLEIIAGTDLTEMDLKQADQDTTGKHYFSFILNESAVQSLGWTPQNAIGRKMNLGEDRAGEVKAVVRDFHFASLHTAIEPLVIFPSSYHNVMLVKLTGQQLPQTLEFLDRKWKSLEPSLPFEYQFMNEEFDQLYTSEARIGKAFTVFASLSIFLACLGLFGLATFTILQRSKEISIRKVLGASMSQLIALLSIDFLKLVLIALVIAIPVAWHAMNQWLQGYAYRTGISGWIFVTAGVGALAITLVTVSFQAIKATLANPVKSLRSE
jgi:putative ABC transport system permease protein